MNVKDLFDKGENGTLSYEQFKQLAADAKAKFVDLSEGGYVSRDKYTDDLEAKDTQIATLNTTIGQRDVDLKELQAKLSEAGNNVEKLNEVSSNLSQLQTKYESEVNNYKAQLAEQAYEFAVKDFANSKDFTSNAAKRDFINSMVSKKLTMSEGKIMGAEDFVAEYTQNNADAFVVETPNDNLPPQNDQKPQFVSPTPGLSNNSTNDSGLFHFNFTGVRPHPENK